MNENESKISEFQKSMTHSFEVNNEEMNIYMQSIHGEVSKLNEGIGVQIVDLKDRIDQFSQTSNHPYTPERLEEIFTHLATVISCMLLSISMQ